LSLGAAQVPAAHNSTVALFRRRDVFSDMTGRASGVLLYAGLMALRFSVEFLHIRTFVQHPPRPWRVTSA
jgi:hypothetical protein